MNEQLAIDFDAARETTDAAVDAGGAGADHVWVALAKHAVENLARHRGRLPAGDARRRFIVDEVWKVLKDVGAKRPADGRAMGAVMRRAAEQGLIRRTGHYRPSDQVQCHRNPRSEWESIVEL